MSDRNPLTWDIFEGPSRRTGSEPFPRYGARQRQQEIIASMKIERERQWARSRSPFSVSDLVPPCRDVSPSNDVYEPLHYLGEKEIDLGAESEVGAQGESKDDDSHVRLIRKYNVSDSYELPSKRDLASSKIFAVNSISNNPLRCNSEAEKKPETKTALTGVFPERNPPTYHCNNVCNPSPLCYPNRGFDVTDKEESTTPLTSRSPVCWERERVRQGWPLPTPIPHPSPVSTPSKISTPRLGLPQDYFSGPHTSLVINPISNTQGGF
ncbi:hypothetical protein BO71DRAFT_18834 [Aspergillus ellipticus CBS 707.79]|uniref:Uncharacterized protein n=1 Tax=Aspergillus ellipticus CBS 707.79 TaxID=1448320 RepID=A0A319DN64_9EURO|nr:hypothetical protein BO71DRAFT_18834 [Aspergillus ellipticus CBS 707.79]